MTPLRRPEFFAALFLRWLMLCVGLGWVPVWGQTAVDGAVSGVVEGGGAAVSLRNLETGQVSNGRVRGDGSFLVTHLVPGSYSVAVGGVGNGAVTVSVGETTEVRATVRGGTVAVVSENGLAEGQSGPEVPDGDGDGLLSWHGLPGMLNGAVVDGVGATQGLGAVPVGTGSDPAPDPDGESDSAERTTGPANGLGRGRHAGAAYVFSQGAVREVRAVGGSYSAQNAGAAGAVVTTVSRAGTGQLHGLAGYTVRSQAFAATNPLAIATSYANGVVTSGPVKPHDLRESYVGTLAGPVPGVKSLVFFYAFDGQRRGFPAVSSPVDANFYDLTATQRSLLANRGVTTAATNTALNYLSSLTGETARQADQALNFFRMDWTRHPRVQLAWQYNAVRWNAPAGLVAAPVVARGRASIGSAAGSLDSVLVRATTNAGAGIVNQAHVAFTRDLQYETPQRPLAQEPAISPGGLAPEVNIGLNGLLFGTPAGLSQVAYPDERRVEVGDTLSVVRGRHLLVVGASVSFVHEFVATSGNAAGTFHYDSGATGGFAGGLVDFITDSTFNVNTVPNGGCPAITAAAHDFCFRSFSQSFGVSSSTFSTEEWAGYVEDTWRPRRNLTVHAGARYEYTLLPIPQNPNVTLDAIFGSRGATGSFPEDRNNFGPRAAVLWEPLGFGRGIVRIGYGVFYGRLPGATIRSALSDTAQAGGETRIRITPSAVVSCPQAPSNGFGYPCAFIAQPSGVVAATTSAMLFDRRFRLPVVQQGSLALERNFGRGTTVSVGYVLNLDRQLPSSTDLNIATSTQTEMFRLQGGTGAAGVRDGETFALPVYTSRLTPSFGPVTDVVSNVNATYHALLVSAESRPSARLTMRGEYVWSKAIDYGANQSATPRTDGQLDPFTNGYDKGLSSLNYPWAFHGAAVWEPRVSAGERWVREALNGWQVAPILAAHAGRPYSFDLSGGTRLPGGYESLNGSGGALYLPTVGRNTLRLPALVTVDLRVARGFRAGKKMQVRATAEAFNLLNRQNISSVTQRGFLVGTAVGGVTPLLFQSAAEIAAEGLNTQAFGTATAASSGLARERQVQFGVQVWF